MNQEEYDPYVANPMPNLYIEMNNNKMLLKHCLQTDALRTEEQQEETLHDIEMITKKYNCTIPEDALGFLTRETKGML